MCTQHEVVILEFHELLSLEDGQTDETDNQQECAGLCNKSTPYSGNT